MPEPLTTLVLAVLATLAVTASVTAVLGLFRRDDSAPTRTRLRSLSAGLLLVVLLGTIAVFVSRALLLHRKWVPLEAHVDGLLLIAALFGAALLYVQSRHLLRGSVAFGLPILAFLLTWAVCASWWTFRPFGEIASVWMHTHLLSVYLGALSGAVAATAGATYLFARRRLRRRMALDPALPMPSLESLERLIARTAALGFALITLGIVAGLIHELSSTAPPLGPGWWHSPKIIVSVLVWLMYALLINVTGSAAFRGRRAAWISIAAMLLVLTNFGIVGADAARRHPAAASPPAGPGPIPAPVPDPARVPGPAPGPATAPGPDSPPAPHPSPDDRREVP